MIYLDNAATTLHKPPAVISAVELAMKTMASPGRGGHQAALSAADAVFACRQRAARMFGVAQPDQVVFTMNATHALNIAIRSAVKPGDTVVITGYEHNAVTRTLASIEDVHVLVADSQLFQPEETLARVEQLLQTNPVTTVICNHVSNVFGYVQPAEAIGALCDRFGVTYLVDASQSAGVLPVHVGNLKADFVAMPGHKGLYGPQGTGILLCTGDVSPFISGGTGSDSIRQEMPDFLPDRLEAGTHNVPGIAGLEKGISFVERVGIKAILAHDQSLIGRASTRLSVLPGVHVYAAKRPGLQTGVLSFTIEGLDCETVGERLSERGVAVRAGLHCAPLAHKTAGTLSSGTVRASVSAFNTVREIDRFIGLVDGLRRKG